MHPANGGEAGTRLERLTATLRAYYWGVLFLSGVWGMSWKYMQVFDLLYAKFCPLSNYF